MMCGGATPTDLKLSHKLRNDAWGKGVSLLLLQWKPGLCSFEEPQSLRVRSQRFLRSFLTEPEICYEKFIYGRVSKWTSMTPWRNGSASDSSFERFKQDNLKVARSNRVGVNFILSF